MAALGGRPADCCANVKIPLAGILSPGLSEFKMEKSRSYNDTVVRQFAVMTVVWGIVGMAVGVLIAAQLMWPALNLDLPWFHFGRLRPLHTNAVIFAFGGCALFATSYYVVQRTCHVRLFAGPLAAFSFWGWQLVIVLAAVTLPLGLTQGVDLADRRPDRRRLGRLRDRLFRHHRDSACQAYLRRQLVLRSLHHHGGDSAHRQLAGDPGRCPALVPDLRRSRRRDGPVVVWA